MRKAFPIAIAVALSLCVAAIAVAQSSSSNVYKVTGRIASGGTKKRPKHVAIVFDYTVGTNDGTLSKPVSKYSIHFAGLRQNLKNVAGGRYCSAASINTAGNDRGCARATHVGTGLVRSFIGAAGRAIDPSAKCDLKLDMYVGGPSSLALYLHGSPPQCIAGISQAIDAKVSTDSTGGSLSYSVPANLLHPVAGLDAGITSVSSTVAKGAGDRGPFTSIGCKGSRTIKVTFTEEGGGTGTATTSGGKC
ncbi:hypothetical protein [Conexibacter woesei]|uniref:hypothetical protein n=1 Tax=Conexibacter woesei TaxID=191495 RepID=UPI0003FEFC54|nr:hypothetical protein [Conexibacter woesei]